MKNGRFQHDVIMQWPLHENILPEIIQQTSCSYGQRNKMASKVKPFVNKYMLSLKSEVH